MRESKNGKKRWSLARILVIAAVGLIFSLAAAAMYCSGTWNLNRFYDVGEVYDVWLGEFLPIGAEYHQDNKTFTVTENEASVRYMVRNSEQEWNYMYVYLSQMSDDFMETVIRYYDINGKLLLEQQTTLTEGENILSLKGIILGSVEFCFQNQTDKSFYLYKLQFREKEIVFSIAELLGTAALLFAVYLVVAAAACRLMKGRKTRNKAGLLEGLWDIYIVIFQNIGEKISKIPARIRSFVRVGILVLIFFNMFLTAKYGSYLKADFYKYYIGSQILLLCVWAVFCMRKNMKKVSCRSGFVKAWCAMCILMCISDFFVAKRFALTGIWVLLVFGLVFLCQANLDSRSELLREFASAVRITFWVFCAACFLFYPFEVNNYAGAYMGMTKNPNTLGEFMAIVFVVELALLEECMYWKKGIMRIWISVAGMISSLAFIRMSDCRNAYLVVLVGIVIALAKICTNLKLRSYRKNILIALTAVVILYLPVTYLSYLGVERMGTQEEQAIEQDIVYSGREIVYAGQISVEQVERYNKLDTYASGRLTIWKTYLQNMNLWGHSGDATVCERNGNVRMGAHNMLLTIGYRYGVFTVIPYTVVIVYMLIYGFRYMSKSVRTAGAYSLVPFLCAVACIIEAMLDNMEQPMRYSPWFVLYFLMGFILIQAAEAEKSRGLI